MHPAGAMCTGKRQTHIRNAPSSRTAVTSIDPYNAYRHCIKNSELHQASREKSRKTKGVFLVGSRGTGGKSKSPRARFLFPIFSFGEAKEKTGQQPQIFNTSSYLAVRLKMLRLFVYSTPVTS